MSIQLFTAVDSKKFDFTTPNVTEFTVDGKEFVLIERIDPSTGLSQKVLLHYDELSLEQQMCYSQEFLKKNKIDFEVLKCKIVRLERGISSVESGISTVARGISSVERGISTVESGISSVESGISSVEKRINSVGIGMSSLESKVKDLESDMNNSKVEREKRAQDMLQSLAEIKEILNPAQDKQKPSFLESFCSTLQSFFFSPGGNS